MSDIVARLRDDERSESAICRQAADEIERLRAQLHLAEVVRAAQVEGLTQGAAGWRERANQLEAEVAGLQRAVEYYRAGQEKRAPKWVPSKVWLAGHVRGDYPIGHTTIAHEGEYECESNRYGAVSVIAENGQRLGVKPSEFEVVAWRENTPDAARKGTT